MQQQVARRPSPRLQGAVRSIVGYRHDDLPPGEHTGMPSTTLTFVVPTDHPLDVSFRGGRRAFDAIVGGLHTSPATIHHGARQHGVQVAIDPLACRSLLGVPASALTEQVVELDELWGRRAAELIESVHDASGTAGWCRAATSRLEPADVQQPRREISRAWALILSSGGLCTVGSLADEVGWSRRHLEEQFRLELGITPKQACRLRRFEYAVHLVRGDHDLAEAAALAGFTDQPHLTRDWKDLAGTTPGRWRREDQLAFVQDAARSLRHHQEHD